MPKASADDTASERLETPLTAYQLLDDQVLNKGTASRSNPLRLPLTT
jgi:hypothetical protein